MKALIVLLCCSVLVVTNCHGSKVIVLGSKFIRPKQPYTVAFANPSTSNVNLKLFLKCDNFQKQASLQLKRQAGKTHSFDVPDIEESNCSFSAVNDGGSIEVNHNIKLLFPKKSLSIFILTDKPIYKPGEVLRFRVVVLDIALKPAKHIKSVEINIEDKDGNSKRLWSHAKLHNGLFESSYRLASAPILGMWNITVKVEDNSISNERIQQFEVREYVLPKFVVKVAPSRNLLISDQEISLHVAAHYTFGEPVQGIVRVELFTNDKFVRKGSHELVKTFDSSAQLTFQLNDKLLPEEGSDHVLVKANVSVTEKFSNFTAIVIKEIPVYRYPYRISLIKPAMYYRPGGDYFCKLSVKDHNGIPVDKPGASIKLKTDTDDVDSELNNQGIASFVLQMPSEDETVTLSAKFEGEEYEEIASIEGSEELTSSQYLQVYTKNRIIPGRTVSFTINSNEHFTQLSYFVVSRGSIVLAGHQKLSKRKAYTLKVKLTAEMAPHARLLVYTVKDGLLIMDFFEMEFEAFGNEFEYTLDEETYRPDQDFYVDIVAEKDSYVAFQAVDQGALLLGHEEFGLTKENVLMDLDRYVRDEDEDNSVDLIDSFGFFLKHGAEAPEFGGSSRVGRQKRQTYRKPVFLRVDFPEAWLWRNSTMANKPKHTITDLVPDTITSWYVTGFALSPSRGLGLMSAPKKFTVSKPFYMIANLPYSIKRNETVRIQITLFNFLGNSLTTDVTLFNKNEEIEFVDRQSTDTKRRKKAIVVPNNQATPLSFLIKAKKLGEIAIKIEAVNELASDGLEHMLRVVPESRLVKETKARFIDLPSHNTTSFSITANIPREADPGSTKIFVVIDPPFVASTASNLEALFEIPTGAGDLNLLTFIPNIVVLDYLKEKNKVSDIIETKAKDLLSSGYQNQLKYLHDDGAFGQWNPPKGKPSVFLTALVANALTTAAKHIKVKYEDIERAFTWISEKQKPNGCFQEDGEVIHPPMQDASSSFALTAFVVAAVMENTNISSRFTSLAEKGVKCLASNFNSLTSMHDIALATYALSLANHAKRKEYLDKLIEKSIRDPDSGRYWNEDSNVEIAGYALMSYLAQSNTIDAIPIMRWLNNQRYSTGRFAGVHSTFVALKALGKMATRIINNDYRVQIGYGKHKQYFDTTTLGPLESIQHELPDDKNLRKFDFKFEGIGFGSFFLTYQYHRNIQMSNPSFTLSVVVPSSNTYNVQYLKVCLSYRPKEHLQVSGVSLVEVYLPSGLVFNDNAVRDTSNQIKKTERAFDNTALFVYYSALTTKQVCFEVTAYRKFEIANHRPSYVVVYDTSDYEKFAIHEYEGKVLQLCDICDDEDCKSMSC